MNNKQQFSVKYKTYIISNQNRANKRSTKVVRMTKAYNSKDLPFGLFPSFDKLICNLTNVKIKTLGVD